MAVNFRGMDKFLNPSLVVILALMLSTAMTLLSNGQINWEKLASDSITFYFVYLRGKNDGQQ